jgi:hypothetical protein
MKKPQLVRLGLQCLQGWEESAGEVTERIVALLPFEQSGRARQHLEGMVREVGRGHPPDPLFQTADAQAAVPAPHASLLPDMVADHEYLKLVSGPQ